MPGPTFAVVGCGILGCLTARELAARVPSARISVFDRAAAGSGASRLSAGLHIPAGATPEVRQFAAYAEDAYAALAAQQPHLPIRSLPMTIVAAPSSAARIEGTYLPGRLTRTVGPGPDAVRAPQDAAYWKAEGCHYADVAGLIDALLADLRHDKGADVRVAEGVRVQELSAGEAGVEIGLSTGERLTVDHAVLAPGPWVHDPAWRELLSPLGLRVKKIVALHVEVPPEEGDGAVYFPDEEAFLLPMHRRGHWLLSYTCPEWDPVPDSLPEPLAARHLEQGRALLRRYAPSFTEHCGSGRVFCDAYSPDRVPRVRTVSESPGGARIVFAGAANGSGYRLAPALAHAAANLLVPSTEPPRSRSTS